MSDAIVRVKLWSRDGRILYSDEPELIGHRYRLGAEEKEFFETGGADAEISDLSAPENRYERQEGKLLEAHTPIRTPDGTQVLFEIYQRFGSVSAVRPASCAARPAAGRGAAGPAADPASAGSSVTRPAPAAQPRGARAPADQRDRRLERRTPADRLRPARRRGAGPGRRGLGLAPLAEDAAKRGSVGEASALRDAIARLRQGVREMRTLLVAIHPPSLETTGIEAALHDLLSPLEAEGIAPSSTWSTARAPPSAGLSRGPRGTAQRAGARGCPHCARGGLTSHGGPTRLVVADDGRGFAAGDRARRGDGARRPDAAGGPRARCPRDAPP